VGSLDLSSDSLKINVHILSFDSIYILTNSKQNYTKNRVFVDDERILYCLKVCNLE
jgi:hypothetical protein